MSSLPASRVVSIGAVHYDTIAHASVRIRRETSTPASFNAKPGGVATNIARAVARLGIETRLIGTVGDDSAAQMLRNQLSGEGIDLSLVERPGFNTGQYLALHDPDGALAAACVDDRVLTEAPDTLFDVAIRQEAKTTAHPVIWFVDANLPESMLVRALSRIDHGLRIANAVSDTKAQRLRSVLKDLYCLTLNRSEAVALTGRSSNASLQELADALSGLGVARFVLTNGKDDVAVFSPEGLQHLSPPQTSVVDVTGAGDALTAALIAALARGYDLSAAARFGVSAAKLTLESTGALADGLTWPALQSGERKGDL